MVRYTDDALLQLRLIQQNEGFSKAQRLKKQSEIRAAIKLIAQRPLIAPSGDIEGTREKLVHPFVIVYEVEHDGILILNVWDQRQGRELI
jgi:plasmid stabilization system protein ParE